MNICVTLPGTCRFDKISQHIHLWNSQIYIIFLKNIRGILKLYSHSVYFQSMSDTDSKNLMLKVSYVSTVCIMIGIIMGLSHFTEVGIHIRIITEIVQLLQVVYM